MDDEEMAEPEADLAMDMDPEADEEGEEAETDAEEAMDNVEDAIAELRAAFADMMGDEPAEESVEMEATDAVEEEAVEEASEETVEAVEEGASMSAVSVSHSDSSDKGSPVAGNAKAPNDAKAHSAPGGDEKGRPAPAAKPMGVDGPQEAGSPSPAPKAKAESNKSDSPIRGMK